MTLSDGEGMAEDGDMQDWLDELLDEEEEIEPGTQEYLEVVERAEQLAKRVEAFDQIVKGRKQTSSLRSES